MTKKRKQYSTDEKMAALRQHLLEKQPVSDVCDRYGLQPTVSYRWQKRLFERGGEVLRSSRDTETTRLRRQITQLEKKLVQKDKYCSSPATQSGWAGSKCVLLPKLGLDYLLLLTFFAPTGRCKSRVLRNWGKYE